MVNFIGADLAAPIASRSNVQSVLPQQSALSHAQEYGSLFGLRDPANELRTVKTQDNPDGRSTVRFQQIHGGVPVIAGDDPNTLAARVLRVEHLLYPRVVNAIAGGRLTLAECRSGPRLVAHSDAEFIMLSRKDDCLAEDIDRALDC